MIALIAMVLGVVALAAVAGSLIWAIVAMHGPGRGLVVGGLALTLVSRLSMGVFPMVLAGADTRDYAILMITQNVLALLGTVGLVLVVAGAVAASKQARAGVPRLPSWGQPNQPAAPRLSDPQPRPDQRP